VTVVVGVDGAGRTHRLRELAPAGSVWVTPDTPSVPAAPAALVVDDPHRLDDATLHALCAAGRQGVPVLLGRRPTIDRPALAALDELVARAGVHQLIPLDAAGLAGVTGRPSTPEEVAASGGLPGVAALAGTPGLLARVQRRLATAGPGVADVARVVALGLDLADDVVAAASGQTADGLAVALRELRDGGFLVPGDERMVPAVAEALLADLAPAQRRRVHDAVARALVASGADPVLAATQLRAARIRTGADVFRAAGDRLRFTDPAAAIGWYDDAADAGADLASLVVGRAEAAVLVGLPVDLDTAPLHRHDTARGPAAADNADGRRLALVAGVVAAREGRPARAAEVLLAAGASGRVLAAPALVSLGRLAEAESVLAGGPSSTETVDKGPFLLARAVLEAARAPAAAVPMLIEAAEQAPPAVILPDTPHAWGAVVAVTAGDAATAEHLLRRALDHGIGGPAAALRHRLLLAWVRLRSGRYDTAVAELRRLDADLPGREALLATALRAGLARRSGDIARLREAWTTVEPVLARQAVDLFQAEQIEELAVAATRLRRPQRIVPVLDALDATVDALGRPSAWRVTVEWIRLQLGVATDDAAAVSAAAQAITAAAPKESRQRAQEAAATAWVRSMAGDVDVAAVVAAVDGLAAAELPWEASRLAGHAAIRTPDPSVARRLLEVARDLSGAEPSGPAAPAGTPAGLSEREVEVARLVLDGRTHKEIGAQLFISPKTVEHHVARIRTKVGATDRAEFVAALKQLMNPEADS